MLRLAPMAVTTRHSASAYPFQCQAGLPLVGPIIGHEVLGQGMFCYDPFCLYESETLLSPCMLVSGNKGYGKSAFVKAYLHRQSMAGKWLAILDPKGEYLDLAERDGLSVLSLRPNGPVRLNPLDSGPTLDANGTDDIRSRRIGVVVALAESAVGRPVTSDERSVVTAALMELERRGGRAVPTLRHVMELLMAPAPAMATELNGDTDELAADAKSVARGLHRLVEGDLAGMFDGVSSTDSRLVRARHRHRSVRRAAESRLLGHLGLRRSLVGPGGGGQGPSTHHRGRRMLESHSRRRLRGLGRGDPKALPGLRRPVPHHRAADLRPDRAG